MKLHLLEGLGADEQALTCLTLDCDVRVNEWKPPMATESIKTGATRLARA